PIRSSTLLLPKSFLVPKKLGLKPKSSSPPMMPAPIHPPLTPNPARPVSKLLPAFADTHGLTKPSARAADGADMAAAAAATIRALITHRMMFSAPSGRSIVIPRPGNTHPEHEAASDVP